MHSETQRRFTYRELSRTLISTVFVKLPKTTPIIESRPIQKQTRAPDNAPKSPLKYVPSILHVLECLKNPNLMKPSTSQN